MSTDRLPAAEFSPDPAKPLSEPDKIDPGSKWREYMASRYETE